MSATSIPTKAKSRISTLRAQGRSARPGYRQGICSPNEEYSGTDKDEQRDQLQDRHNPDRAGTGSNAADIYPGERSENEQNDQKMGASVGENRSHRADRIGEQSHDSRRNRESR